MRKTELKRVRKSLTTVLKTTDLDSGQENRLRTTQRELDKIIASGKLDHTRIFRVVDNLATLLLEIQQRENSDD